MTSRTPLFNRAQPGGVHTISDVVAHPGDIWWVNSATGVDGAGYGQNPDSPTATINYAIGLATASKGDVIYVMPGHLETIINATTIVPNKAGISIIGLGRGTKRPVIDFNNAAAKVIVSGANCRLSNLIFRATITDVVIGLDVTASDVEVDNCLFTYTDTADEFILMVRCATVNRVNFHDNVFETYSGSAASAKAFSLNATTDMTIQRNVFRGKWTDAVFFCTGAASTRLLILDNVVYNSDTTEYGVFDAGGLAMTGMLVNNNVTSLYATGTKVARLNRLTSALVTFHFNSWAQTALDRGLTAIPATSST